MLRSPSTPDFLPAEFNWSLKIQQEFDQYPAVKAYLNDKKSEENDDPASIYQRLCDFDPAKIFRHKLAAVNLLNGLSQENVWPPFFKKQWQPPEGEKVSDHLFMCALDAGNFKLAYWWVARNCMDTVKACELTLACSDDVDVFLSIVKEGTQVNRDFLKKLETMVSIFSLAASGKTTQYNNIALTLVTEIYPQYHDVDVTFKSAFLIAAANNGNLVVLQKLETYFNFHFKADYTVGPATQEPSILKLDFNSVMKQGTPELLDYIFSEKGYIPHPIQFLNLIRASFLGRNLATLTFFVETFQEKFNFRSSELAFATIETAHDTNYHECFLFLASHFPQAVRSHTPSDEIVERSLKIKLTETGYQDLRAPSKLNEVSVDLNVEVKMLERRVALLQKEQKGRSSKLGLMRSPTPTHHEAEDDYVHVSCLTPSATNG